MQNYQKKKFDKKKKNTENIFPYIIFSNISEKLMAENLDLHKNMLKREQISKLKN